MATKQRQIIDRGQQLVALQLLLDAVRCLEALVADEREAPWRADMVVGT
jgi:hypothetical protein